MPTESKILAGVCALVLSFEIGRHFTKKKYEPKLTETVELAVNLWQDNLELRGEVSYLINEVIEKRDITLDEFDLIALPHVNVK